MKWFWILYAYLATEAFINILFHYVNNWLKEPDQAKNDNRYRQIFKGILERLFLIFGLMAGYPQVLIAFGALKIGTRFQKDSKISNDYFLIGNFISLLTAILFVIFIDKIIGF